MAGIKKYTPERLKKIKEAFKVYIKTNKIPILKEFALMQGIPRQKFYEFEELRELRERCLDKKEVGLERAMLQPGIKNVAGFIFSLKQLGWKDKNDITVDGEVKSKTNITGEVKLNTDGKHLAAVINILAESGAFSGAEQEADPGTIPEAN